ncbi:MAG: glycosyltransferase family 2 protein [Rhodobacteraceae bacterium]|nr:glycosyltransferase family 2 protein [Paracoccaceae bacterium]
MRAAPRVSVVIASHRRPAALTLCLTALRFQDYRPFEVIVAADAPGLAAIAKAGLIGRIKTVQVDAAGISAARNAGLALAAGDIVAFIDDDAVAEHSWLSHLVAPFDDPQVAAAGGYVRGRNGISFQWRARWADACGRHFALSVPGEMPSLHRGGPGRAIRTEGTNMAFRRAVLAEMGGFDPGYRYFLDETDVNMRLARAGAVTAIVPLAQVHHGYAPSARRRFDRAPRSLHDIGASSARYIRKFAPEDDHDAALCDLRTGQRRVLIGHMVSGRIEPRDVAGLLRGLDAGIAEGLRAPLTPPAPLRGDPPPFCAFVTEAPRSPVCLAGRGWWRRDLRRRAARLAAQGYPVTLFVLSHSALFHRMTMLPDGVWLQRGGLFGRSDRAGRMFRPWGLCARISFEKARMAGIRPLKDAADVSGW